MTTDRIRANIDKQEDRLRAARATQRNAAFRGQYDRAACEEERKAATRLYNLRCALKRAEVTA